MAGSPDETESRVDRVDARLPELPRGGAPQPEPGESSESYQRRYQQDKKAEKYNAMYRDSWAKSLSTRRECSLLDRLLESRGHCRTLLDLP
jgi:hypothetical protein